MIKVNEEWRLFLFGVEKRREGFRFVSFYLGFIVGEVC